MGEKQEYCTQRILELLTVQLSARHDPVRAEGARRYMRNQYTFLGVDSPTRRSIVHGILKNYTTPTQAGLMELVLELWERPQREYQYAGIDILNLGKKQLNEGYLEEVEPLIMRKSWWDTVDGLNASIRQVVKEHPEGVEVMHAWVRNENIWITRSAILHQLGCKTDTDPTRLAEICVVRLKDKEFFIAKAIGWALRDYSYTNPSWVQDFVNAHQMQPLTRREALKAINRQGGM
jgi:3-methyladenine DNA glycosylase AlkD